MFWIKLLILNLILITSTIIGITFSKKYAYRVKELQEMKNALNIFMTKIKFTYEPIPSTFMYISEKVEGNVCKLFKNAIEEIKPAHLAYMLEFTFNTNQELKNKTHSNLSQFTHTQIREVIE